ncbi:MAG: cytochrome c-type biogenesis protein CcmH [Proteobacteria bacterium]|nr:cytochrome c-type biogenesis protein CcmH [Pseudomonadota bacterium]
MKRVIVLLTSLLLTTAASAIDTGRAFDDPQLQARYLKIISEVRCVQCQNQSIKDSNVPLASDLRREIRRLISEGKTDADIADFLVARYGEFVLYRPKMLALWIIPFLLLSIGGFALFRIVRHRMTLPMDDDATGDGQSQ